MKQNWRKRTEIEMKTTRKSLPNINLQPDETQKIRIMHRVLRSSYIEMKSVKIGTWKWETKPNEIETWIKTEEKHRNFKWKLQENHSTQVGLDSQNHNQAKLEPTKTDKPSKMKWKSWWRPKKITEFRDENSKKTTTHKWVWTRPPKTKPNWNQKTNQAQWNGKHSSKPKKIIELRSDNSPQPWRGNGLTESKCSLLIMLASITNMVTVRNPARICLGSTPILQISCVVLCKITEAKRELMNGQRREERLGIGDWDGDLSQLCELIFGAVPPPTLHLENDWLPKISYSFFALFFNVINEDKSHVPFPFFFILFLYNPMCFTLILLNHFIKFIFMKSSLKIWGNKCFLIWCITPLYIYIYIFKSQIKEIW